MRIITGKYRGRKIIAPSRLPVRPTTDQAKEALFNIIGNNFYFEEINVLDLFAGTGNISYEFCSRGVRSVCSVDVNNQCVAFIKKTAETLKMDNFEVVRSDVFRFLKVHDGIYNIIFADPPYNLEGIESLPSLVFNKGILKKEGWLIIEHSKSINFSGAEFLLEERRYGKVNFSIFCYK